MSAIKACRCGHIDLRMAPHSVNGDPAVVMYQVMGAPQHGREAHTARECFREVLATEAWGLALETWKASLGTASEALTPMPVGHVMFSAIPGSAAGVRA